MALGFPGARLREDVLALVGMGEAPGCAISLTPFSPPHRGLESRNKTQDVSGMHSRCAHPQLSSPAALPALAPLPVCAHSPAHKSGSGDSVGDTSWPVHPACVMLGPSLALGFHPRCPCRIPCLLPDISEPLREGWKPCPSCPSTALHVLPFHWGSAAMARSETALTAGRLQWHKDLRAGC